MAAEGGFFGPLAPFTSILTFGLGRSKGKGRRAYIERIKRYGINPPPPGESGARGKLVIRTGLLWPFQIPPSEPAPPQDSAPPPPAPLPVPDPVFPGGGPAEPQIPGGVFPPFPAEFPFPVGGSGQLPPRLPPGLEAPDLRVVRILLGQLKRGGIWGIVIGTVIDQVLRRAGEAEVLPPAGVGLPQPIPKPKTPGKVVPIGKPGGVKPIVRTSKPVPRVPAVEAAGRPARPPSPGTLPPVERIDPVSELEAVRRAERVKMGQPLPPLQKTSPVSPPKPSIPAPPPSVPGPVLAQVGQLGLTAGLLALVAAGAAAGRKSAPRSVLAPAGPRIDLTTPSTPTAPGLPNTIPNIGGSPNVSPQIQVSPALQLQPLTQAQAQAQPQARARECESVQRRRRRKGKCREGFFKEYPGRTEYTTWAERDCATRKAIKRT